jgi:hypothetical protein
MLVDMPAVLRAASARCRRFVGIARDSVNAPRPFVRSDGVIDNAWPDGIVAFRGIIAARD